MSRPMRLLPLALAVLACGCTTFVRSDIAAADSEGIEYSLPVPVIRVTPQADGTMAVVVDYLPDPDATYVLRTSSLLSSYTLDVQRENGMLKSVSLEASSDGVAKAVIDAEANLIKARQDDAAKRRADAAGALAEDAKAIGQARLNLAVATAKLDTLLANNGSADQVLAARLAVAEAQARLDFVAGAARGPGVADVSGFTDALASDRLGDVAQDGFAAAPVLFRVVPVAPKVVGEPWGVALRAFEGPRFLPTGRIEAAKPAPPAPRIQIDGSAVFDGAGKAPLELVLVIDRAIHRADPSTSGLWRIADGSNVSDRILGVNANTATSASKILVTLKRPLPSGRYKLAPAMFDAAGKSVSAAVEFTIR